MRRKALWAGMGLAIITALSAVSAQAGAYRRPQDAAVPGAPFPQHHVGQSDVAYAWNGMEGPSYSYGYALNLPPDGNWRWIEARCYGSRAGETCVDGHWIRRQAGRCEEVTSHSVRRGRYIRIVPAGPVNTCRR
jgi:hypothetical protein